MKWIWKFLITLFAGLAVAGMIASSKEVFSQTVAADVYHILSDAFFVVGVVLSGFGALIFVSNEGVFDMTVYGLQSFFDLFRKTSKKKYATFYDYRVARQDKKMQFSYLLVVGVIYVAVASVMLVLYLRQG